MPRRITGQYTDRSAGMRVRSTSLGQGEVHGGSLGGKQALAGGPACPNHDAKPGAVASRNRKALCMLTRLRAGLGGV